MSSALSAGRSRAVSMMLDAGSALRPTGNTVQNPDTGREVPEYAVVFTSVCKVAGSSAGSSDPQGRTVDIGGVDRVVMTAGLHLPISAPLVKAGWEWRIDAVGPDSDPQLLGRRFRIIEAPAKSYATARRLDVVEVPA